MANLFMSLALALVLAPAYSANWKDDCESASELAELVMTKRQKGVPLSELMNAVSASEEVEGIILGAYEYPQYDTKEKQQRAIDTWRDDVYIWCAEELKDGDK